MDIADLAFDGLKMSLKPLKNRSVRLSQEVGAQLGGPPRLDMDRVMDISTGDHGSF